MKLRSSEESSPRDKDVSHEAEALSTQSNKAESKPKGKL